MWDHNLEIGKTKHTVLASALTLPGSTRRLSSQREQERRNAKNQSGYLGKRRQVPGPHYTNHSNSNQARENGSHSQEKSMTSS